MCCHTYSHLFGECGDEGMTLLNSCQVIKSLALFGNMWQTTQLIWGSIEQVSSPACPSGGFRYVLSHVWSKSPNIVELGDLALGPKLSTPIKDWKRYVDDVFSIIPKGNSNTMLQYLNSIDPHIKFTIEQPNEEGGIPFLNTFPKPKGEGIGVSVYRKPTHTDRYLDFNSSHSILAKRAVVRALMDQAENVCSDPDILAKEMEHLNRVLHYNNYPQWMIDKWGKSDKNDPIIHPETGVEIQKHFYISVPYFPGLSESYKKIFKYTPIQVCFKGVKSLLMHPKDKISINQMQDIVYHWECQMGATHPTLEKPLGLLAKVKEHSKSTTSAILHCKDIHHPLPSISDFSIIDKSLSNHQRGQRSHSYKKAGPSQLKYL